MKDGVYVDKRPLVSLIRLCALMDEFWGIAGITSGKPKYKNGVPVAKVGGILNARDGCFSIPIQAFSRRFAAKMGQLMTRVLEHGLAPEDALAEVLHEIADSIRGSIKEKGHYVTGKLYDNIGWIVRRGSRGGRTIAKGA